jgi:hypothetical protein
MFPVFDGTCIIKWRQVGGLWLDVSLCVEFEEKSFPFHDIKKEDTFQGVRMGLFYSLE